MSPKPLEASPSGYPRVYRVDRKTRRVIYWIAAIVCGFLFVLTAVDSIRFPERFLGPGQLASTVLFNGIIDALMLAGCLRVFSYVILYEDAVEVKGLFSTRRLRRDEIRGWRMQKSSYPAAIFSYVIVPLDKGTKELKLPPFLHVDKFFYAWKKTIPKVRR